MDYKIIFDNDILFFSFQNSSSWTLANTTGAFIGKQRLHILGNSDAHYFRLFGKLEKKKKKKWKCQVTKLARSWMSDNKTQHKKFQFTWIPGSPLWIGEWAMASSQQRWRLSSSFHLYLSEV